LNDLAENGARAQVSASLRPGAAIDKTSRTTQHPGTVLHQISDPKDADDHTISSDKKKIIHSNTLDQKKGHVLSIQQGKHTRTTDPTKGITDSVNDGKHVRTTDSDKGIIDSVANGAHKHILDAVAGISAISSAAINHTAPTLAHNGNTSVSGTLGVGGAASFAKGLSSGALEVAADSDGGLVQCTMGLAVTGGLTIDTATLTGILQLPAMTIAQILAIPFPVPGMVAFCSDTVALTTPTWGRLWRAAAQLLLIVLLATGLFGIMADLRLVSTLTSQKLTLSGACPISAYSSA
jgi:hypothetical protein